MNKTRKKIFLSSLLFFLACTLVFFIFLSLSFTKTASGLSRTLDSDTLYRFSRNNILFYNPNGGCLSGNLNGWNGTELTYEDLDKASTTDWKPRLKLIIETYGELAMQLQENYGVPWEVIFTHFNEESSVGMSDGVNGHVKAAGKYNMMGMKYSSINNLATECYKGWACYDTMSDMITAWAISFMRNGMYNAAFAYLDPNNYNLDSFISTMVYVYAPPSENDTEKYIRDAKKYINGVVEEVRVAKGWPTSAELAKQRNIQIGGKYPLDTTSKKWNTKEIFADLESGNSLSSSVSPYSYSILRSPLASTSLSTVNYCAEGESCTKDGFTTYSQGDPRWNGGNSSWPTMSSNGCGPSAFATAATNLLRQKITPKEVADYMCANGLTCGSPMPRGDASKLAQHFGLEFKDLTDEVKATDPAKAEQTINEYLKNGWIIQGVFTGCFTSSGGHYLLIRGLTSDGKWKIATNTNTGLASKAEPCGGFIGSSTLQNEVVWDPQAYIINRIKGTTTFAIRSGSGTRADTCSSQSSSDGSLKSGGMTLAEAKEFMKRYRQEASKKQKGAIKFEGALAGSDWVFVFGGSLNNCSAFSQWFVNRYTTAGPNLPPIQGSRTVKYLLGLNKGFVDGGHVPKPYAVMSMGPSSGKANGYSNHTGIVLGVDVERNKIIIGEASYHAGYNENWPDAHEYDLSRYTSTVTYAPTYAYTDNILKDTK